MSKASMTEETAATITALLGKASEGSSSLASAAALGVAGGAGAVFAMQHHGRVRAERAARQKG